MPRASRPIRSVYARDPYSDGSFGKTMRGEVDSSVTFATPGQSITSSGPGLRDYLQANFGNAGFSGVTYAAGSRSNLGENEALIRQQAQNIDASRNKGNRRYNEDTGRAYWSTDGQQMTSGEGLLGSALMARFSPFVATKPEDRPQESTHRNNGFGMPNKSWGAAAGSTRPYRTVTQSQQTRASSRGEAPPVDPFKQNEQYLEDKTGFDRYGRQVSTLRPWERSY